MSLCELHSSLDYTAVFTILQLPSKTLRVDPVAPILSSGFNPFTFYFLTFYPKPKQSSFYLLEYIVKFEKMNEVMAVLKGVRVVGSAV